jgi:aryl-alcohol dehydrogenase-like predicted oxidoreductase
MPYGITNQIGQVPEVEVRRILDLATASGINLLDTAQAYGNAEAVLGRQLPLAHGFRLISKLPAQPQPEFSAEDADAWEQAFRASCQRLGVCSLNALLLHAPADLAKPGGQHLEDWLLGLRQRGLVKRLGVSIYTDDDLDGVHPDLLDLVQLPLSLFDQRLLQDGTVAKLRAHGTVVHARSLYLQGLLLTPSAQWPSWVSPEVRAHQQALEALADHRGCRLIELALGFAREQTDLEAVVLGVCSVRELREVQQAWAAISPWKDCEWRLWALKDPSILDPRRWPQ